MDKNTETQDESGRKVHSLESTEFQEPDMEEIFKELYGAMEESEQEDCELCTSNDLSGLVDKAKKFLDKVEDILERAGVELPVYALFCCAKRLA